MIPSALFFLESLPLTPNGKVDRAALLSYGKSESVPSMYSSNAHTEVEKRLAEIWADVLRIKRSDIDENFFDSGGDSLSAMDLFCWIEKEFGKRLSPSSLLKAPTVRQLATIIEKGQQAESGSPVFPIRSEGSRPPLFCIPHVARSALIFNQLAHYLPTDQPVYGIDSEESVFDSSVEKIASYYADEIRKIVPDGPFFLIGFSSGGVIAFEIARQMHSLHLQVPFVALIDTVSPFGVRKFSWWKAIFTVNFFKNLPFWLYYFLPFWYSHYRKIIKDKVPRMIKEKFPGRIGSRVHENQIKD